MAGFAKVRRREGNVAEACCPNCGEWTSWTELICIVEGIPDVMMPNDLPMLKGGELFRCLYCGEKLELERKGWAIWWLNKEEVS